MTLTDLKGQLLARRANLEAQCMDRRKTVLCIEADLIRARREADMTEGALQANELALADAERALQAAEKAVAPAKNPPAGTAKT